jgi:hypothetical protein
MCAALPSALNPLMSPLLLASVHIARSPHARLPRSVGPEPPPPKERIVPSRQLRFNGDMK